MSLAAFTFTDRARPVIELGIGDTRTPTGQAQWDVARWDNPAAKWASTDPVWTDITCDVRTAHVEYGRQATTDRFVPGVATLEVDNASGWADPNAVAAPGVLTMRPGRSLRIGFVHETLGAVWRFRGFVDVVRPTYTPAGADTVVLEVVDALGEVNRAKNKPLAAPVGDGETVSARMGRILDRSSWAPAKRDIAASSLTLIADAIGGQTADLLGRAADSAGGSVFGDYDANVTFRARDWQTYLPGTPVDGTIGNVAPSDVCPVGWVRPFARADITTRAIMGRDEATAVVVDDANGQLAYGIEPFERTDLLTKVDADLTTLANRVIATRSSSTAPRVRSVTLDARTSVAALDLMTSVDVYRPSRYRCRLRYPRGTVFDAEHFATAVVHDITPSSWTLELALDLAAPYAATGARWDSGRWDRSTWAVAP